MKKTTLRCIRHWFGMLALAGAAAHAQQAGVAAGVPAAAPAPALSCPPPVPALTQPQIDAQLRSTQDRGFLWRISRDGRASWLYGTLHVGKAEWAVPGPRVRRAIGRSEIVALELDLLDPQVVQAMLAPGDAQRSERLMGQPDRQLALAREARRACVPGDGLAALRPIMQAMTLLSLAGRADGYYPDYSADLVLAGVSRGAGKPLVGLESPQDQLALLAGGSEQEEGELIDQTLAQLASGRARQGLAELAEVWARGDLARLESYPQWCDCLNTPTERALMQRMLGERNRAMAQGIERLHAGGQSVLAAVGALHMPGDDGLLALLRARGFEVLRVSFDRPLPGTAQP